MSSGEINLDTSSERTYENGEDVTARVRADQMVEGMQTVVIYVFPNDPHDDCPIILASLSMRMEGWMSHSGRRAPQRSGGQGKERGRFPGNSLVTLR